MDEPNDICAMLGHYYPERAMTEEERTRVVQCIGEGGIRITPAQVEQLAMEEDTLAGFLDHLCVYGKEDERKGIPSNFVIQAAGDPKKGISQGATLATVSSSPTRSLDATESESADGDY